MKSICIFSRRPAILSAVFYTIFMFFLYFKFYFHHINIYILNNIVFFPFIFLHYIIIPFLYFAFNAYICILCHFKIQCGLMWQDDRFQLDWIGNGKGCTIILMRRPCNIFTYFHATHKCDIPNLNCIKSTLNFKLRQSVEKNLK